MALFFGRVDKSQWEHSALFANIVPVYINGINTESPDITCANGCPEWILSLATWLVCNVPMPYDGFMFTYVRRIN